MFNKSVKERNMTIVQSMLGVTACFLIMFAFVNYVIPEALKRENKRQVVVQQHLCNNYSEAMNEYSRSKGIDDVCE